MDEQIIDDLRFVNQKFFRNTAGWKKVLNFLIEYGISPDKPTGETAEITLTKAEEDRVTRLCNFMADMIAKYGKAEVLRQIKEAA